MSNELNASEGRRKSNRAAVGRRQLRQQTGSALILTVIVVTAIVAITLPVVVFYANMSTQARLQSQARHVAAQTAVVVDDYKYWLDAERPGWNESEARAQAEKAARVMGNKLGLERVAAVITFDKDAQNNSITRCRLVGDASKLFPLRPNIFGFDMAAQFSGRVDVTGEHVHSNIQPYSLIHMDSPTREDEVLTRPLGFNQRDVAVIPAYGLFYTAVGGETKVGTPYGKGIAENLTPDNFRALNHYHLKKVDLDTVIEKNQEAHLTSYNKIRFHNNFDEGREPVAVPVPVPPPAPVPPPPPPPAPTPDPEPEQGGGRFRGDPRGF